MTALYVTGRIDLVLEETWRAIMGLGAEEWLHMTYVLITK